MSNRHEEELMKLRAEAHDLALGTRERDETIADLRAELERTRPVVEAACAVRDTCTADDPRDHWAAISRINTVVAAYRMSGKAETKRNEPYD